MACMTGEKKRLWLSGKRERKSIEYLRRMFKLPPVKQGTRKCLNCDREFKSCDIITNRLCNSCNVRAIKYNDCSKGELVGI